MQNYGGLIVRMAVPKGVTAGLAQTSFLPNLTTVSTFEFAGDNGESGTAMQPGTTLADYRVWGQTTGVRPHPEVPILPRYNNLKAYHGGGGLLSASFTDPIDINLVGVAALWEMDIFYRDLDIPVCQQLLHDYRKETAIVSGSCVPMIVPGLWLADVGWRVGNHIIFELIVAISEHQY